jgi:hypothetical protein
LDRNPTSKTWVACEVNFENDTEQGVLARISYEQLPQYPDHGIEFLTHDNENESVVRLILNIGFFSALSEFMRYSMNFCP